MTAINNPTPTPRHPAPRRLAFGLMLLFVIALAWSIFGQVDIVAVAPGRIIVSERTKLIQPLEASVVKKVLVKDGDRVQAGQLLVELDPTNASADKASLQEQLNAAASEVWRTQALQQLLLNQKQINEQIRMLDANLIHNSQKTQKNGSNIPDLGILSSFTPLNLAAAQAQLQSEWHDIRARLAEAQSTLAESEQARAAFKAETQRLLNDRHAAATSKLQQLIQEGSKASQRERQTQLTAPVAGVIQQLAIHSVGGVVTPAQPLMIVVPDTQEITAEISIANQDIGFVNAGQAAEVKLETFPYTKYGTVKARVNIVTADAVTDEKKGSYYPATITLNQKDMLIDGKRVNLSPGMNITAEIKTGQRRVIEYLLSPVQRAGSESLRER